MVIDLIAGGVTDRHPTLRVGVFESGLGWIPYWLDRLDEHFEVMGHHTPWLKRRPSEIFASQCFVSMEPDEAKRPQWMAEKGLAHCILWGSDYPHFDSTYPAHSLRHRGPSTQPAKGSRPRSSARIRSDTSGSLEPRLGEPRAREPFPFPLLVQPWRRGKI